VAGAATSQSSSSTTSTRTVAWWRSPGDPAGELAHVGLASLLLRPPGGDQLGDELGDQLADLRGQVPAVLAELLVL